MDKQLFKEAIAKVSAGIVLMALLLFLPAGTVRYPGGWRLMTVLFIPMVIAGFVMMAKNPELLRRRLDAREKESEQKTVVALSGVMFLAGFIAAGLDFRFGWSQMPVWATATGTVLFLLSYLLYAEVLRENAYLSRTIKVQENQKVVDTGLYGVVRHPMYAATIVLFLSMPLVLGSLVCFVIFLVYPILIAKRIRNEEEVLERELTGYKEYKQRIRWRVIPFLW